MRDIVLLGASGRVGRSLSDEFKTMDFTVNEIAARDNILHVKMRLNRPLLVNAAGIAHVNYPANDESVAAIYAGNLALLDKVAEFALELNAPLIHLSSSKANLDAGDRLYAASKRLGEELLIDKYLARFNRAGLHMRILRIPAVLAPPFDSGKLRIAGMLSCFIPPIKTASPAITVTSLAHIISSESAHPSGVPEAIPRSAHASWFEVRSALRR